jgi:hypothetical protein
MTPNGAMRLSIRTVVEGHGTGVDHLTCIACRLRFRRHKIPLKRGLA